MTGTFSHTIWSRYYLKLLIIVCILGIAAMMIVFKGLPDIFYLSGSASITALCGVFGLSFFQTSRNHLNQQVTVSFILVLLTLHELLFFAPSLALVQTCFVIGSLGYALLLGEPKHLRIYLIGQVVAVIINLSLGQGDFSSLLPFAVIYSLAASCYYLLVNRMLNKQRELWLMKQAESKIREELEAQSEQLREYKHIHDLTSNMVCITDFTGYFIHVNKAFEETMGYTAQELMSRPFKEFIHPDDKNTTQNKVTDMMNKGSGTPDFINRYCTKDGRVIYLQWNAKADLQRGKIYCTVRDITKQKLAEESVKAYQMRLKSLFDQNTVGITMTTMDGGIVMANPAMERVLGYGKKELARMSLKDLTFSGDLHLLEDSIFLLESGERPTFTFEKRCRKKDGSLCWVRAELGMLRSEHGEPAYLICTIIDISEQKQGEKDLRQSEAYLLQAQKVASMGHWTVHLRDMVPNWSEETYRIHEMDPELVPSLEEAIDFYDEPSRVIITEAFTRCVSDGTPFDLVLGLVTSKGNRKWVRSIGAPEYENREIIKVFGVFQDITSQVDTELQLRAARVEAEEAAQAKTMFLSNMSHEIRTPLNALIGSTHLMLQDNPTEDQKEMLEIMQFSGNNLISLVNDILDYNKMEAGKLTLESIEVEIPKFLSSLSQSHQYRAKEKGISLKVEVGEGVPSHILADPTRLTQIINNLTSNAIKFTDKGGVTIRAEVKSTEEEGMVNLILSVIDTGIGIPADKLEDVFGSFTQASAETTRKYGGTGLGLAISKNLIELMEGNISLESQVGQGSVFTVSITVPVTTGTSKLETKPIMQEQDFPLKDCSILLVEDNAVNVKIATKFLNKWGAEVALANNGQEAIDMVKETSYDIVLMDIRMPVLGGVEATIEIRTFNTTTPIVALTASTLAEVREEFMEIGFNGFITKPFRPAELLAEIQTVSLLSVE